MKEFLVQNFPEVGHLKRFSVALLQTLFAKKSYSQHGEDLIVQKLLGTYDKSKYIYLDIGANHPTSISNTYLLYRHGWHGIVVEPNTELCRLFRIFRKRDIVFPIGCGNVNCVLKFYVSKTPVVSSFHKIQSNTIFRTSLAPILRLDDAVSKFLDRTIIFISIDVEGLNYEVLEGGLNTVKGAKFLCIEFANSEERLRINVLMAELKFILLKEIHCNLIFENSNFEE